MSTSLHVGKKRDQVVSSSDGATLAPGAVGASASAPGIVQIQTDPTNTTIRLTGVAPGTVTVTYSATGYASITDTITVVPAPALVVTDGPEF